MHSAPPRASPLPRTIADRKLEAGSWKDGQLDLTTVAYRTEFDRTPDGRDRPPTRVRENTVSEFSPGLGVTWLASEALTVFTSVHRGFSPPAPGSSADNEESTNYEFGLRWFGKALNAEVVGFWNDYSNLVGTCTESTGGGCVIGDQFDGGETRIRGVEASLGYDLGKAMGWRLGVPLAFNYTYTDAEFRTSFLSEFGEFGQVEKGDKLAYLPEHMFHAELGVSGERWRATVGGNYIDAMRVVAGRGRIPPGQATDQTWVFDFSAAYALAAGAEVFVRVENVFDEEYISSRRPAGPRPGRPRASFVGLRLSF